MDQFAYFQRNQTNFLAIFTLNKKTTRLWTSSHVIMKILYKISARRYKAKHIMHTSKHPAIILILATLLLAAAHSIVKVMGTWFTPTQLAWIRFIVGPITLFPIIWINRTLLTVHSWPLMIARSVFGILGMLGYFWALILGHPGEVSLIFQTSAIWTVILGYLIFQESVSKWTRVSLPLAFLGLYFVVIPDKYSSLSLAHGIAFIASLLNTGVFLTLRKLRKNHGSTAIMFWNYTLASIFLMPGVITDSWPTFSVPLILGLVGIAGLGYLGNYCMTIGFKYCSAGIGGSIMLLTVPWLYLSSILVFQHEINLRSIMGTCLVLGSIVMISWKK